MILGTTYTTTTNSTRYSYLIAGPEDGAADEDAEEEGPGRGPGGDDLHPDVDHGLKAHGQARGIAQVEGSSNGSAMERRLTSRLRRTPGWQAA